MQGFRRVTVDDLRPRKIAPGALTHVGATDPAQQAMLARLNSLGLRLKELRSMKADDVSQSDRSIVDTIRQLRLATADYTDALRAAREGGNDE